MPRPGPRPYECVRRAWHSDRHKPMRGSIIQQICRVAYETHSTVTKKNREWQEKLPLVVIKAEEIMYSKANSEAEYMNLDTIWDRIRDAINTIIRRDETNEQGDLLPPCVEAALNLGCIPVRASRSQRHSNPRTYLNPRMQESAAYPTVRDATNTELPPLHSASFARTDLTVNSTLPISESQSTEKANVSANAHARHCCPFRCENIPREEKCMQMNSCSVYPLYYLHQNQVQESPLACLFPREVNSGNILVGEPIGISVQEPAKVSVLKNLFSCSSADIVSTKMIESAFKDTHENPPKLEEDCDLSLRLGPFSEP